MSKLIRMDSTGHTTLAEWTREDADGFAAAVTLFDAEIGRGFLGIATQADGSAEVITQLHPDVANVILRRPIAGG